MKLKNLALTFLLLVCSSAAFAWPTCKGQWVSVPKTTTGGVLYSTGDLLFQCQTIPVPPVTPDPKPTNVSSNSSSNASSNSAATAGASASATGGKATATGGNASQSQKQNQSQLNNQQQSTSQNANSSASNSGNNSNYESNSSETYNQIRQAPLAYAPTIIPSNCQGSISGGVSAPIGGISLGGSKADKNCQRLALAAAFAAMRNFSAAAKVLCSLDGAKAAHLSLAECQATFYPAPVVVAPVIAAPVVVAPAAAPEVRVIMIEPPITVTAPKEVVRHTVRPRAVVKKKPTANCPVVPESLKHPTVNEK